MSACGRLYTCDSSQKFLYGRPQLQVWHSHQSQTISQSMAFLSLADLREIQVSFSFLFNFESLFYRFFFFFFFFFFLPWWSTNDLLGENLQVASSKLWNPPVVPGWTLTSANAFFGVRASASRGKSDAVLWPQEMFTFLKKHANGKSKRGVRAWNRLKAVSVPTRSLESGCVCHGRPAGLHALRASCNDFALNFMLLKLCAMFDTSSLAAVPRSSLINSKAAWLSKWKSNW